MNENALHQTVVISTAAAAEEVQKASRGFHPLSLSLVMDMVGHLPGRLEKFCPLQFRW